MESETHDFVVPTRRARWLLLHYHLFKNAGSTIEYVLERGFGDRFATLHGPTPDSTLGQEDLRAFLDRNPDVTAISSHHLSYPKPAIPDLIVFDLCFLRDPLQRLWSVYKYLRRADAVDELGLAAKAMSAKDFMDLLIRDHPEVVNDVQVNWLANHGAYTRPPARVDLEVALGYMRQMSVLGVVDLFDESLVAAEYFLRPAFPIEFQYVRCNVSPEGRDVAMRPDEALRAELGERTWNNLRNLNQLDSELLSRAREEVLRRFFLVPDSDQRLEGFLRRCERLRQVHEELQSAGDPCAA